MKSWQSDTLPRQDGKKILITGATGGLGWEMASALAGAGASVLLTGRNDEKGRDALSRIHAVHPNADVRYARLDLASLASISDFAAHYLQQDPHGGTLDVLINNAGVMMPPERLTTVDGFELQLGTNYLGHFALTAQLLPALLRSPAPRVVNLSSLVHRFGAAIRFDDLQWTSNYHPYRAYAQSKLAMLMFTFALQDHSDAAGWPVVSAGVHPGYARTELFKHAAQGKRAGLLQQVIATPFAPLFSQSAADGAQPALYAATAPDVLPRGYYGPSRVFEMKGPVAPARIGASALDASRMQRLWDVSCHLTDCHWRA